MLNFFKNIFSIFYKKDKYSILINEEYNIDLLYYEIFEIKYKSLKEMINILDIILNTNLVMEDIELNNIEIKENKLKGYNFLTDKSLVKEVVVKWKDAKIKVDLLKSLSTPTACYNLRKTELHIIYIEELIEDILNQVEKLTDM